MGSIWLVIIWASVMLSISAISIVVIHRLLKESIDSKLSKLQQAETDLAYELEYINFDELGQTESGKQLLKLFSEESPHLTSQLALSQSEEKKEIAPKASYNKVKRDVIQEKIGNNLTILIEGLPKELITPEIQARIALSLVKFGIPTAGVIGAGVLGGVKTAALQVGGEFYQVKYSIQVLKPVTALDIFGEAVKWIGFQQAYNRIDAEMADDAIEHLRNEFKKEFK